MADATRPGPSIQSMVDRAVAARLKQLDTKGGKKNKDGKKISSTSKAARKPPKAIKGAEPKGGKPKGKQPKPPPKKTGGKQQTKGKGKAKAT
ncbi:hypothetical protein ARMSODRAFT_1020171 [Armillaria solidipes]|uniref:Uncharacterized protein n=1 Tax=Armillaria solidipes TaxID=1076256 RepID=A0A2H3BER0_9AGAR|nr:hypothetical protein ARMSODRAFT_1020171 [Armillaria solidipes]